MKRRFGIAAVLATAALWAPQAAQNVAAVYCYPGDPPAVYQACLAYNATISQQVANQQQLDALFLAPYKTAVAAGVGSVMPSYSSLQILGKDSTPVKMHARADQITGVLKAIKLGYRHCEVPVTKIYPAGKVSYTKMRPFTDWWSILRPVVYVGVGLKK